MIDNPREGRRIGIETVYQDLAPADDLSVGANIFLGREPVWRLFGILPFVDDARVLAETEELLARIESRIPSTAGPVLSLSDGQRQAVAIARVLYWNAKVVVLDEPTAALAGMQREHVIAMARRLASEGVG